MRIRATAAMAAVLLCAASASSAQTAPPKPPIIYGQGVSSCGTWLAARGELPRHLAQISWVLGWLSAAGHYSVTSDLRETDSDAVAAWVDKYCREHPLNDISDAAASLVDELSKPK